MDILEGSGISQRCYYWLQLSNGHCRYCYYVHVSELCGRYGKALVLCTYIYVCIGMYCMYARLGGYLGLRIQVHNNLFVSNSRESQIIRGRMICV